MTRQEHLEFCKKCLNRKFDPKHGVICNLTQRIADFEGDCDNFKLDETVKEKAIDNDEFSNKEVINKLDNKVLNKLRPHQDFYYAITGGLLATLISAVLWAVITVTTQYQIGFMAIGVGIIVGFSVQFFGAGIDRKFGYLGAILSLIGCSLGNLFSQVGFIAQEQSLGYFETLTYLNFEIIVEILIESFNPLDVLFYGFAIFEGYKFAFRRVSAHELLKLKSDDYDGHPSNSKLRMPLVIVSIMVIVFFLFKINTGVSGFKTFQYESGKKMSEGEMVNSKEQGKWTFWYENGNTQSIAFFSNGIPDSLWQWFNESGKILRIGNYEKGLEHGVWMNYYENGSLSDSGSYFKGRMNGKWKYLYENGSLNQSGYFNRDLQDSTWKTYYENGQLSSIGEMDNGNPLGLWINYYENGQIETKIKHLPNNKIVIEEAWDIGKNQIVSNGNGIYKAFSNTGQLMVKGKVENGQKIGTWIMYFENGKTKEEGIYENEIYRTTNSWDFHGNQNIIDGQGFYKAFYPDGEYILETGIIESGLREGEWKLYYESPDVVYQVQNYKNGKLTGVQKIYFESNQLYSSGEMKNGLREGEWSWYFENGNISSTVNFSKDKKEGEQTMWNEVGEISKKEYYKNGELIEEKIF